MLSGLAAMLRGLRRCSRARRDAAGLVAMLSGLAAMLWGSAAMISGCAAMLPGLWRCSEDLRQCARACGDALGPGLAVMLPGLRRCPRGLRRRIWVFGDVLGACMVAFSRPTGSYTHMCIFKFSLPGSRKQYPNLCNQRAHPDMNQGPADLQSAALTTELCTRCIFLMYNDYQLCKRTNCP